jgi:2-C-methyl-D-erythritol 4-phosphate cytidylyltransferase
MSGSSSSSSSPDPMARAGAVIAAAGSSSRMSGGSKPKQYLELLGAPVLLWSMRAFVAHPGIDEVVVVLPAADAASPPSWIGSLPVTVVAGGETRRASVRNGLQALGDDVEFVLVHDGARPLVPSSVIDRVLEACREAAAIAALPVADTVKMADDQGNVARTVDRSGLWLAQTPQGFRLDTLRDVHRRADADDYTGTDDAGLCERYGIPVRLVEGAVENMKITRPADFPVVEALAARVAGEPPASGNPQRLL